MEYTIKEVAKMRNMPAHTIRYYCDMGLVPNVRRDEYGNRIFDEESVNWIRAIWYLRGSGMSLREVKEYFSLCEQGEGTRQQRYEMLLKLQKDMEKKLARMQTNLDCLKNKVQHYEDIAAGKCEDDCNPLNW